MRNLLKSLHKQLMILIKLKMLVRERIMLILEWNKCIRCQWTITSRKGWMLNLIYKENRCNSLIKGSFKIRNNLRWFKKCRKENLDVYIFIIVIKLIIYHPHYVWTILSLVNKPDNLLCKFCQSSLVNNFLKLSKMKILY